jgi:hypothetical protein
MPHALTRRHLLAGAAATAACAAMPAAAIGEQVFDLDKFLQVAVAETERLHPGTGAVDIAIVVSVEETPIGATITDWMPGVPYVRGEVVRWGLRLYWCRDFLAEQGACVGICR